MFRKTILILVVVFIWQFVQAPSVRAQNADPCTAKTTWWFPDPIPFGWYFYGGYAGTFVYMIAAHTCPKVCPTCNQNAPTAQGGEPIVFATGDTYISDTDVSLPGLGGGLVLRRRWNSVWPNGEITSSVGIFGSQWKSTYDERIYMDGGNYVTYARGDGSYTSFLFQASSGNFVGGGASNMSIPPLPSTGITTLNFQNGEQRQFAPGTGVLTAIVDRNGNTTQLTYDASNRLTTVTDPASRHLYFHYPNGSSYLVTSMTSDFGVSLSYTYDTNNRLTQVTKPDLTTITYTYNSQSQITQVTDSNGKVLESHTYDSNGRGLTSSKANGVNSLTLSYPQ